jgi:hypothetical protein
MGKETTAYTGLRKGESEVIGYDAGLDASQYAESWHLK